LVIYGIILTELLGLLTAQGKVALRKNKLQNSAYLISDLL